MKFALDLGFIKVEVKGYALVVIKMMNTPDFDFSLIGNIIDEARCKITMFQSCLFKHIERK